jgi:hypothetical protein
MLYFACHGSYIIVYEKVFGILFNIFTIVVVVPAVFGERSRQCRKKTNQKACGVDLKRELLYLAI